MGVSVITRDTFKRDGPCIRCDESAHRDSSEREKNLTSFTINPVFRFDTVSYSAYSTLYDHFRALVTRKMCAINPTTPNIILVFVQNRVHNGVANIEFTIIGFVASQRNIVESPREPTVTHSDDAIVGVDYACPALSIRVDGSHGTQEGSCHEIFVPFDH